MDSSMFYVAGILALAPTLILMYVLLRKYTFPYVERPYFSDPSFFILFAVGLVCGVIMFFVFTYIIGNLIALIFYALIQVMVPMVVMNLKRYRGKTDSVFYGLGFGLGAGGATAAGFIFYVVAVGTAGTTGGSSMGIGDWAFVLIIGLAMIFQYTAVGTTVGEAIARHELVQFGIQAMIYNVVFWIVFILMESLSSTPILMYVMAVACLVISIFYLWYSQVKEVAVIADEVDRQNNIPVGSRHRPKRL